MTRRDSIRVREYLEHIAQAIANIVEYTRGMDKAAYVSDRKTQDAVVRNLEVIGEACNNVSQYHPDFASKHPQVPWKFAYEMRNALAHGYFTVDHGIVWQTIQTDLPGLGAEIQVILNRLPGS
jgi:uncharacterized protein with HEPN domain